MKTTRAMFGEIYTFTQNNMKSVRDNLGITAVIPDEYTFHFSGFKLPPELTENGPLAGWRDRSRELARHQEVYSLSCDAWPVFPGIAGQCDDRNLQILIEEADKLGMEVWGHIGLWGYCGDIMPEIGFKQVTGEPLQDSGLYWGNPLCPNNDELIKWTGDCLAYAASHYGIKAMDTDHGHFPPAVNLDGVFGCTCAFCAEKAARWGYDFDAMKGAVKKLKSAVSAVTSARFTLAAGKSENFLQFLVNLAEEDALNNWFAFRMHSVNNHMATLTHRVHKSVGNDCPVDSHYMPPSIAALSGQAIPGWEKTIDRFTPGWGAVVGWDQTPALSIAAIARRFNAVCGLSPSLCLPELVRLFGYEDAGILPLDVDQLEALDYNINKAMLHEIRLAKTQLSEDMPSLFPFRLAAYDEASQACAQEVLELGQGSFVFSDPSALTNLAKLSRFLKTNNHL